jgi:pimeloyl-ACP methyl ester carboxylesterase
VDTPALNAVLRINDELETLPSVSFTLPNGVILKGRTLPSMNTQETNSPAHVVLCLHGYLDNCHSFGPMMSVLDLESRSAGPSASTFTSSTRPIFAIDFAGHGRSSHRSVDAHYHSSDYIQDIVALITSQRWQKVTLVGHSMGGIIACSVAAVLPDIIERLILLETAGPLVDAESQTVTQMRTSIESRMAATQKSPKQPAHYEAVLQARMKVSDLSIAHADMLMRRNLRFDVPSDEVTVEAACRWGTDSRLRTVSTLRFTHAQAQNIIEHIVCPVTMLIAEHGFERVKQQAKERAEWFRTLNVIHAPGNHYVHMQYPQLIADILHTST